MRMWLSCRDQVFELEVACMVYDGFVEIAERLIPYRYKNGIITVCFELTPINLPDGIDTLKTREVGCLTSKRTLFKLRIPLQNSGIAMENNKTENVEVVVLDQKRDVEFSVEDYDDSAVYTEMRFDFPELDYFCPSSKMCNIEDGKVEVIRNPIYSLNDQIRYKGTDIKVSLNTLATVKYGVKAITETRTNLVLTFSETNDFSYIFGLYNSVKAFFAFVCNRQNVALHQATLIGTCMGKRIKDGHIIEGKRRLSSQFVPVEKYVEPDEDGNTISKTIRLEYYKQHFVNLFQMFFEKETGENALLGSGEIHASVKYRNLIDLRQSLHITAAFEFYVRTLLPEVYSQSSIDFCNDVSAFLDTYINEHTGKKKEKAKSFKRGLSPSLSLSEKMRKVIEGYDGWAPIKPVLRDWFGSDYIALTKAANDWRNELAHEKRSYEPDENTVMAIRLVEHLNYSIVLRIAGYSDEEISAILENTLAR